MVYPVGFDPQGRGQLRHGQEPGHAPRAGPAVAMQTPVPQANRLDRAGEHPGPLGRAKPFRRQALGDGLIGVALRLQTQYLRFHLGKARYSRAACPRSTALPAH